MPQSSWSMSHDLIALRLPRDIDNRPDNGRELDRRRRPLADGPRGGVDPARLTGNLFSPAVGSDVIGRAVWESAARARRLGETVPMILNGDDARGEGRGDRPSSTVISVSLAGLGLWAIALFLLGLE